jgi:lysophospholipase L1-like esterase
VLSLLIGVNDVWHRLDAGRPFAIDDFARRYEALLETTVATLPSLRLVLCEPFFLPGPATIAQLPLWQRHLAGEQELVARLARRFGATLVCFQAIFDAAVQRAAADHWLWDGVHPTPAGHRLMADEWLRVAGHLLPPRDPA